MSVGYLYVDRDDDRCAGATVGDRVTLTELAPPWFVVAHALESVCAARWPGRLLRVRIDDPTTEAERVAMARAAAELKPSADFTRAFAVEVLEELPAEILFGPHGAEVAAVIDRAADLTREQALQLAHDRHRDAAAGYSAAWRRWLTAQPGGRSYADGDHDGVLHVPGAGHSGSPIGDGLLLISSAVHAAARAAAGNAAFRVLSDDYDEIDDVDGVEDDDAHGWHWVLLDPWVRALDALLDAGMALGAPELVDSSEAAALLHAWRALTGDSPTP